MNCLSTANKQNNKTISKCGKIFANKYNEKEKCAPNVVLKFFEACRLWLKTPGNEGTFPFFLWFFNSQFNGFSL